MKSNSLLSKSKYLNGLQCPKLLWVTVNEPSRLPPIDAATQHTFDEGREVGKLAKRLYPGGIDLPTNVFMKNVRLTKDSLALRLPLFEAGLLSGRLYCRVDILNPAGDNSWDIIEVKSSTSVKNDEHLPDVAFQCLTCRLAGIEINRCYVMHIKKQFAKIGEIEPADFFEVEDVTDLLPGYVDGIEERTKNMLDCLDSAEPEAAIGRCCSDPRECALQEECWAHMPEHHVMTLHWGGALGEKLLRQGILTIAGIPEDVRLNAKQEIQRQCVISGTPHIDQAQVRGFLRQLKYPLYFLDFETFRLAIPIYDGTRPYQQIMFQFSLDACKTDGDEPEHFGYLAEGPDDPRPGLLKELKKHIGHEGSIVVYNKSFEEGRLEESALAFPEERPWIQNVIGRMLDLMAPFKGFLYYHPEQCGSYSLKKVLPPLAGISYEGMDIAEGDTAMLRYLEAAFGDIDEPTRIKIRSDLEAYCGLDTRGMIAVAQQLRKLSQPL